MASNASILATFHTDTSEPAMEMNIKAKQVSTSVEVPSWKGIEPGRAACNSFTSSTLAAKLPADRIST
ncbi:hypothetical protein D3C81_2337270 [compost metagenome]